MAELLKEKREGVGKRLTAWDTSEIIQNEMDSMKENWEDYFDEEPTDEQLETRASTDFTFEQAWDDFKYDFGEILKTKNPDGYWKIEVDGFGWRGLDGSKKLYAKDAEAFLRGILPETDCTYYIYNYGKGLAINNFHHDSPTGTEWYYATPIQESTFTKEDVESDEEMLLTEKYGLTISQKKVLDKFITANKRNLNMWFEPEDYPELMDELEKLNDFESLYQYVARYVSDKVMLEDVEVYGTDEEKKIIKESEKQGGEDDWMKKIKCTKCGKEFWIGKIKFGVNPRKCPKCKNEIKEDIEKYATDEEKKILKEWDSKKTMNWKEYGEKLKNKSIEELKAIRKDAHEAALAADEMAKAGLPNNGGYYWDEVHMVSDELRKREKISKKG